MAKKASIQKVKLDELTIDRRVQRQYLDEGRAQRIADEFDMNAFGVLCVSKREDGTQVILDGWHRTEGARRAGYQDLSANAEVFTGLSLADEAAIFRLRNNTRVVGYMDKFRVRLIEGDDVAVGLVAMLNRHGWGIEGEPDTKHQWWSVQSLESLYKYSPDIAERAVSIITDAWGRDVSSADYRVVKGLGAFLKRYGTKVDVSNLIERLRMYPGGPGHLIGNAQGVRSIYGGAIATAIAELITNTYNKYKKASGRLPEWRTTHVSE